MAAGEECPVNQFLRSLLVGQCSRLSGTLAVAQNSVTIDNQGA